MNDDFFILRAEPVASAVCAMTRLHALSFTEAWTEKSFRDFAASGNCTAYFAYSRTENEEPGAGSAIGFLLLQGDRTETDILTFAVAPEYRGRGVGAALLCETVAALRREGVQKIFLEVKESNQTALSLYMRSGFREIGRRKNYYGYGSPRSSEIISADALTLALVINNEIAMN